MTSDRVGLCWQCGCELTTHDYGRETNCLKCGKATRVCRNCRWYDPARTNQCREPMADKVQDKARANYCGYFEPTTALTVAGTPTEDQQRQAAEDLFK